MFAEQNVAAKTRNSAAECHSGRLPLAWPALPAERLPGRRRPAADPGVPRSADHVTDAGRPPTSRRQTPPGDQAGPAPAQPDTGT